MATKRHNYGAGSNAGILGACFVLNFWQLFLLLMIILWIPLYLWAIIGVVVALFVLGYYIYKEIK